MKFNFKKIASVLVGTVMLSSTLAFAAATALPAPFVQGGSANGAIVVGTNPAVNLDGGDIAAATNIMTYLNGRITEVPTGGNVSIEGGDYVVLESESGNDKFNLGDLANSFYTTLDEDNLAVVLSTDEYINDAGEDFEYEQEIALGPMALKFFQDSEYNDEKPLAGFDLVSGDSILNYTLTFTPNAAEGGTSFNDLETTNLKMLGKVFYISEVSSTANGVKIELLDTANSVIVNSGEPVTVTVGNQSFEVSLNNVNGGHDSATDDTATITVGTTKLSPVNVGNSRKIAEDTYLSVLDVTEADYAGDQEYAEISIGTGKIVLENGEEVEVNDESVSTLEDENGYQSQLTAYITNSSTNIDEITLEWQADGDIWVSPGKELVMPALNTIKFSMAGFTVADQEVTTIKDNGDAIELSTTIKDGDIDLPLLYANSSVHGFGGLGGDDDQVLVTNATVSTDSNTITRLQLNETQNSYFVATWISGDDYESYAYEIGSIDPTDGLNKTTLLSLNDGKDVILKELTDTEDVGQVRFKLIAANDDAKTATIGVAPIGTAGDVYTNLLVSEAGLQMRLPVVSNLAGDGNLNFTGNNPTTWIMNFTEQDDDDVGAGESFTWTMGLDAGDGTEPANTYSGITLYDKEEDSDVKVGYVESDLATYVEFNNPNDDLADLTIKYSGEEAYGEVVVSELGASVSGGASGSTGVPILRDNEVTSTTNTNLVVVGGSCVNSVAAELLGLTYPACGPTWEAKTGVGAGSYLIQSFPRNGKIATLVAGYNSGDTTNAATAFRTLTTVDTAAGKKFKGTTAETIAAVTTVA